jgi:Skp family chaperone for outer membrane proteins
MDSQFIHKKGTDALTNAKRMLHEIEAQAELDATIKDMKDTITNLLADENEELKETVKTLEDRIEILESIKEECLKKISDNNDTIRKLLYTTVCCGLITYTLFYGLYFDCR